MAVSDLVLKAKSVSSNDLIQRVVKTVVEVAAAEAALYTTVLPNPPSTQASAALAGGAGAFALVINLALSWATKSRNKRLAALAAAIDQAVEAKLAAQTQVPATTP